ncbi:MAG: transposase [Pseudomonadota bacterium]|nr:transposase [Pseudomonadota bacterium]
MLEGIISKNVLPFRYVVADTVYGGSSEFISAVEKLTNVVYMVSLPMNTLCWVQGPCVMEKTYRYKGKERKRRVVAEDGDKPITFEKLARRTNDYFWYRRTVSEGTKGPITYEFMRKRVILSDPRG